MSFKYEVREALKEGGINARVTSAGRGIVDLDGVVGVVDEGASAFVVILIDPETGAYEAHGAYTNLAIALSEAVEHLFRYRLFGEHVPADDYELEVVQEEW
jgi:hypothetical protein